jgi:large subunit ribosomal protein L5
MKPRLYQKYMEEVRPALREKRKYGNVHQIPRLEKIVVNMGVSASLEKGAVDDAVRDMTMITGRKPVINKSRHSIANFKLREGQSIGCRVTLRREVMYEFFDRLVAAALPRIRDFRGLSPRSFDGRGNYTLGVGDQTIFPEIELDKIKRTQGMDITIVTSAPTNEEALELLKMMGMPFAEEITRDPFMAKTSWIERNKKKAADGEKIRRLARRTQSQARLRRLEQTAAQRQPHPRGQPLLDVGPAPRLPAQIRLLPPDLSRGGVERIDSRSDQGQLVNFMSDPISNMLTSIRNAGRAMLPHVNRAALPDEGEHRPRPPARRLRGRGGRRRQALQDHQDQTQIHRPQVRHRRFAPGQFARFAPLHSARRMFRACWAAWASRSSPLRRE